MDPHVGKNNQIFHSLHQISVIGGPWENNAMWLKSRSIHQNKRFSHFSPHRLTNTKSSPIKFGSASQKRREKWPCIFSDNRDYRITAPCWCLSLIQDCCDYPQISFIHGPHRVNAHPSYLGNSWNIAYFLGLQELAKCGTPIAIMTA